MKQPYPFQAFKGRFFGIAEIVDNFLNCLTWFGYFRIQISPKIAKKMTKYEIPTHESPFQGGFRGIQDILSK